MAAHRGRLELTWTNKFERLLAHEDASYEWLPRATRHPKLNGVTWRHLLARETDIAQAKGVWRALVGLAVV